MTVVDTGIPQLTSTAEITVDIINTNDNDPAFDEPEYEMSVVENALIGTVVGSVSARDADSGPYGQITYSLVGDHSASFAIDPDTGVITVRNSTALDRERTTEIGLTAIATDRAPDGTSHSTTAPVTIKLLDENDNVPTFSQKIYHATVAENAALNPPAAILQVICFCPVVCGPGFRLGWTVIEN